MNAQGESDQGSAGGAIDEAFILAPDWRLPIETVHAIGRANGLERPDTSMRGYHDGGWFDKDNGEYVATDKLKRLVARRYLEARAAERG